MRVKKNGKKKKFLYRVPMPGERKENAKLTPVLCWFNPPLVAISKYPLDAFSFFAAEFNTKRSLNCDKQNPDNDKKLRTMFYLRA